jgi:carbonic anhydrase/acetyltransferase-like protein (isoleucine patch superfamily)
MITQLLIPVLAFLIYGIALAVAIFPIVFSYSIWLKLAAIMLAPLTFILTFCVVAGALSIPFHSYIRPGQFPRQLDHAIYGKRRLFGFCWTCVYYFTPAYFLILSFPPLKTLILRLFGYKSDTNVTLYPDTWLRDIPLLEFSGGAYLSNKSTIGTNMCLQDGSIIVDSVKVGKNSIVGHLAMIAPGSKIGDFSELGVSSAIGVKAKMGNHTKVGPSTVINHFAFVGNNVEIGAMSYIGIRSKIGDGLHIPSGATIPNAAIVKTQDDIDKYVQASSKTIAAWKDEISKIYLKRAQDKGSE